MGTQCICIKLSFSKAGWEKRKRKVTLWLALCFIQDVTLYVTCVYMQSSFAWGGDKQMLCSMCFLCKTVGLNRSDYILWPSSHFLHLPSLSVGQMSLWGLRLSRNRKARGILESHSDADLVAKVFWLHIILRHPSEACFAASLLLKLVAFLGLFMKLFFKNYPYCLASIVWS